MAGKTISEEGKPQEFICPVKEVQLRSKNSIMEFGHTPLKSPSEILSLLSRTRDIESLGIRLIPDSDSVLFFLDYQDLQLFTLLLSIKFSFIFKLRSKLI